jgi:hypothetical protein
LTQNLEWDETVGIGKIIQRKIKKKIHVWGILFWIVEIIVEKSLEA